MKAIFGTVVVFLTLFNTAALAQIAAPSILPGHVWGMDPAQYFNLANTEVDSAALTRLTFLPENPAAMQWSPHSSMGFGLLSSDGTFKGGAGLKIEAKHKGQFFGGAFVGEYASIGVEYLNFSGDSPLMKNQNGRVSNMAAAFQLFDMFAIGVNDSVFYQDFDFTPAGVRITSRRDATSLGTSIKLGEIFFVGLQSSKEDLTLVNKSNGATVELSRGTQGAGIGLMGSGSTQWHVEIYQISKKEETNGSESLNGEIESGLMAEVQLGDFLLGVHMLDNITRHAQPTATKTNFNTSAINVATVTDSGWTFAYHFDHSTIKPQDSYQYSNGAYNQSLSAGYRF